MPYSQKTSVLLLSFIELLERFSYYGMRAILILFAINKLGFENIKAIEIYGWLTLFTFIIPLPAGIISDAFFKQKNGVLYGGIIALLGYSLLITEQMELVGLGLIFIVVGSGLIKPNLSVLLGRLFEKTDKNRGFAFMFYYFMINLGAFISILIVGILSDNYGYRYGFMATAFSTLLLLLLFYFTKDGLQIIEKNIDDKYNEVNKVNDNILDSEMTRTNKPNPNPHILILIIIFISAFFWQTYEITSNELFLFLDQHSNLSIGPLDFNINFIQIANGILNLIVTILFVLVWYFRGIGSTIVKFGIAMILVGATTQIIGSINSIPFNNIIPILGIVLITQAVAEILIGPFVMSYISRLSDVRYSSTMMGSFLLLTGILSRGLTYFLEIFDSNELIIICSIFAFTIGLFLIFFRKKLLKMSGGLD